MTNMSGPVPELESLGVPYRTMYGTARSIYVDKLQIPWTPEQWVGVIHREGQWLGVCCGVVSAIRDHLMSALANGGWVSPQDLENIIKLMKSHDGFDEWFLPEFVLDDDTLANPLYLLVRMWDAVKDRRWASWVDVPEKRSMLLRQELAGETLEGALRWFNVVELYQNCRGTRRQDTDEEQESSRNSTSRYLVRSELALARVLPALAAFTNSLKWRTAFPIDGFAIVRKDDRDVVVETPDGHAIYGTDDEALDVVGFWCTNDQDNAPKVDDFEIRPVEVSAQRGIVFKDGGAA